jgi:hypothetical protein
MIQKHDQMSLPEYDRYFLFSLLQSCSDVVPLFKMFTVLNELIIELF